MYSQKRLRPFEPRGAFSTALTDTFTGDVPSNKASGCRFVLGPLPNATLRISSVPKATAAEKRMSARPGWPVLSIRNKKNINTPPSIEKTASIVIEFETLNFSGRSCPWYFIDAASKFLEDCDLGSRIRPLRASKVSLDSCKDIAGV